MGETRRGAQRSAAATPRRRQAHADGVACCEGRRPRCGAARASPCARLQGGVTATRLGTPTSPRPSRPGLGSWTPVRAAFGADIPAAKLRRRRERRPMVKVRVGTGSTGRMRWCIRATSPPLPAPRGRRSDGASPRRRSDAKPPPTRRCLAAATTTRARSRVAPPPPAAREA